MITSALSFENSVKFTLVVSGRVSNFISEEFTCHSYTRTMNQETYGLTINDDCHVFTFISEGPKGNISKAVVFKPLLEIPNYFNLSFGDWDRREFRLDDTAISNNQDTQKILGTVAKAVESFLMVNPDAVIFASGSTPARNRLYQMNISKFESEIKERFVVRGGAKQKWLPFKKGINFDSFLLFRK